MQVTLPRVRAVIASSFPTSSTFLLALTAFIVAGCAANKPTLKAPTYTPKPEPAYIEKKASREIDDMPSASNVQYMPVKGVTQQQIANNFGAPRDGGSRSHKGIDIFAPSGRELLAVTAGYVQRSYNNLGGNSVYLRGDNGLTYYYAHLLKYHAGANTGDRVRAGQIVGYVGNSGNAKNTPAHLHFEIKDDGQTINPYYTLRDPDLVVVPVGAISPVEYAENDEPPSSRGGVTAPARALPAKNSGGAARKSTSSAGSVEKKVTKATKFAGKKSAKSASRKLAAKKSKGKQIAAAKKAKNKKKQYVRKSAKASKKNYAHKKGGRGYGKGG
jgi:murein DD-endopeptidase MepM/ murein hydrolase activator NlpD